ncbi:MAG: DUF86 domain-containing protein [Spirochaetaceae bacterium]|nr:DUF86 domain-containing protein [Spirochaetaceae bacterium]
MKKNKRHIQYMKDMIASLTEGVGYAAEYEILLQQNKEIDEKYSKLVMRGLERTFEIAGEAANRVSEEIQNKYKDILWRDMTDMRNVIIHEYDGVRERRLLKVAKEDVPAALEALKKAIEQEEQRLKNG